MFSINFIYLSFNFHFQGIERTFIQDKNVFELPDPVNEFLPSPVLGEMIERLLVKYIMTDLLSAWKWLNTDLERGGWRWYRHRNG